MSGTLKHCPRTTLSWSWMSNALLEPMRRGHVEILEPPEVVTQNCLTGEHVSKVCAFWKSALPLLHARDVLDKRFTYFCATLLLCSLHRVGGCVVRICNYSPRRPICPPRASPPPNQCSNEVSYTIRPNFSASVPLRDLSQRLRPFTGGIWAGSTQKEKAKPPNGRVLPKRLQLIE